MFSKKIVSVVVIAALVLSACGGGGGSSATTPPTTTASAPPAASSPSTSSGSSAPLATSATNPFSANSAQATIFAAVNSYRNQLGVGELADDPILDTAATAHATYLSANLGNGDLGGALSHNEVSTFSDFYADTPLDRAQKAGAPVTEFIGEDLTASSQAAPVAAGTDCVSSLLDTVYHLTGLTDTQQTLGIGFTPVTGGVSATCVLDFGSTTGVYGTPQANAIPVFGGQQMATTAIAHAPGSNETGVALSMTAESPNPAPSITTPGRPLMVRVNAASAGDVLTVSSFTLKDASGNVVAGEILIPSGAVTGSAANAVVDANGLLPPGVVFFIPTQPLIANTVYTASFSGARDGTPISPSWTFTTGAN
jgi:hypothetical protein